MHAGLDAAEEVVQAYPVGQAAVAHRQVGQAIVAAPRDDDQRSSGVSRR